MLRLLEILPGFLTWLTFIAFAIASWQLPVAVAVFIILFDIYWLLKTVFLSLHLRAAFTKMRRNMKINWLQKLQASSFKFQDIHHLVILPMYKEPYAVVRESFRALSAVNYPKDKIMVVLGLEERALFGEDGEAVKETAKRIEEEFGGLFAKFLITVHPAGIPGELPGKGSNETWAAREIKEKVIDSLGIPYDNILVSVFDIDTQVPSDYFGRLTHAFLTCERPQRSSFQPVPLFINNIYQAPAFARVVAFSSTFWHMMQQARPEQLTTFSSHSMPFKALVEIGFWNTNVVSEDSQIFWQAYLHYNGDWRVEPLFYPVSMDANVAQTFWQTMVNIYKQQRRWAWGVENIPYAFYGFYKNKLIPLRSKLYWMFKKTEGFWSWSTNALMIFVLGWLPLWLGGDAFNITVLSYNLPRITSWILLFADFGIASSAILSIILLPPKPQWLKARHYFLYVLQWLFMPLTLIIFGAFPAIDAQTRLMLGGKFRLGFWVTPKWR